MVFGCARLCYLLCIFLQCVKYSTGRPHTRRLYKHRYNGINKVNRFPWSLSDLSTSLIRIHATKPTWSVNQVYGRRQLFRTNNNKTHSRFRINHRQTRREAKRKGHTNKAVNVNYERNNLYRKCRRTSGQERETCVLRFIHALRPDLFVTSTTELKTQTTSGVTTTQTPAAGTFLQTSPTVVILQTSPGTITTSTTIDTSPTVVTTQIPPVGVTTATSTKIRPLTTIVETSPTIETSSKVVTTQLSPGVTIETSPTASTAQTSSTMEARQTSTKTVVTKPTSQEMVTQETPPSRVTTETSTTEAAVPTTTADIVSGFDIAPSVSILPVVTDMMCALCQEQGDAECISAWC